MILNLTDFCNPIISRRKIDFYATPCSYCIKGKLLALCSWKQKWKQSFSLLRNWVVKYFLLSIDFWSPLRLFCQLLLPVSLYRRRQTNLISSPKKVFHIFYTHPVPNLLVVATAYNKFISVQAHSTPADRKGRKTDVLGRKVFSSSSLGIRVVNYHAVMTCYHFHLREKMAAFVQRFPEDKWRLTNDLLTEGHNVAKYALRSSFIASDLSARALASAAFFRRHGWLWSSFSTLTFVSAAQDLPFEGDDLFSSKTDEFLEKLMETRSTAHSLDLYLLTRKRPSVPSFRYQRAY